MNKREAIKAMCDGKKIRQKDWQPYEYLYMDEDGNIEDENNNTYIIDDSNIGWEIYKEPRKPERYEKVVWMREDNNGVCYSVLQDNVIRKSMEIIDTPDVQEDAKQYKVIIEEVIEDTKQHKATIEEILEGTPDDIPF